MLFLLLNQLYWSEIVSRVHCFGSVQVLCRRLKGSFSWWKEND